MESLLEAVKDGARLLVTNHASNVCGTLVHLDSIIDISKEFGIPLLLDAAQTVGCISIDVLKGISLLAFTGHKGLLGPQSTGGLYISSEIELEPLMFGGTGSNSEKQEQPSFLPDKYESGTLNAIGLAGLEAGVRYVINRGVEKIREHEKTLFEILGRGKWTTRVE